MTSLALKRKSMDKRYIAKKVSLSYYDHCLKMGSPSVRVFDYVRLFLCSGCSGFVVEKLFITLWGNLWRKGGNRCGKVYSAKKLVEKAGWFGVLHGLVEKFYYKFSTLLVSVKRGFCTVSTYPTTITTTFYVEERRY